MALGPRLLDHHVVLWLGDLNYRLNLPEDAIVWLLRHKKLHLLKEFDQVRLHASASPPAYDAVPLACLHFSAAHPIASLSPAGMQHACSYVGSGRAAAPAP